MSGYKINRTLLFVLWILIFVFFSIPIHLAAQESSESENNGQSEDIDALKQRIEKLKKEDTEHKKKIQELKTQDAEQGAKHKKELEELQAETEEAAFQASMTEGELDIEDETGQRFRMFGFFDLSFGRFFYDEDSPLSLYGLESNWTFFMSNFNLYIQSYMTETLSMLGELRFSFMPHGSDEDYEYEGIPSEGLPSQGIYGNEYTRTTTRAMDPGSSFAYYPGSVTIERIHLTYTPLDWFNIIAGRYPTPFGIWNVDHGSPVVLPIRLPWFMLRAMVPPSQLGAQIYGRLFPTDQLFFDYAFTVSNGQVSSFDAVQDFDDNKAVGLRLKLSYQGDKVSIAGGAYGFYGKNTETKKIVHIVGLSEKATQDKPLQVEIRDDQVYDIYVLSTDLLIEAFGFRLQSEYIWRYEKRSVTRPIPSNFALLHGASPFQTILEPNVYGNDVYFILAYELPLEEWLATRITPYFMWEFGEPRDLLKYRNVTQYIGGINIKPSPFVTLKLEGLIGVFHLDVYGSHFRAVLTQMAVSF
ncbi:MAG: hypothetical protein GY847_20720 [Proteobacteria bacterium]|nr:hypothetical protein [Pseudomonadota bacterium]